MPQVKPIIRRHGVDHLRDLPKVLVVVIHRQQQLRVVFPDMPLRPQKGFLLKPLDVGLEEGDRLWNILVQGHQFHGCRPLLPQGIGRRTGRIGLEGQRPGPVCHAFPAADDPGIGGQIPFQHGKGHRGDLVAIDGFVAIRTIVVQIGKHRVPDKRAQVHHHLPFAASDQVQVKVIVKQWLLGLGRGGEVVAIPVVQDGRQGRPGAIVGQLLINPDEVIHVGKERMGLFFDLLIDPLFLVQAAPEPKLVEKVHAAFLDGLGYLVKGFADAVIQFLLPQPSDLIGQSKKSSVDTVHGITLLSLYLMSSQGICDRRGET